MKLYIASSEEHVGKILEDQHIRDYFNNLKINSYIQTLAEIVKVAQKEDVVILKSIWGYHLVWREFLNNLEKLKFKGVRLINSYDFVEWNIDKSLYLKDLRHIPVVPTLFLSPDNITENSLKKLSHQLTSSTLVIKPTISASGYSTFLYNTEKPDISILNRIKENVQVKLMVQPYRQSVNLGEYSIIILSGKPIYGVLRYPGVFTDKKEVNYLSRDLIPNEILKITIVLMKFFLNKFNSFPHICRLDFISNSSSFELMEIELIDPDLFFRKIPETVLNISLDVLGDSILG